MKPNTDYFNLTNKVAIITGAARGIGAECGRLLAWHGVKVVLTDISEKEGSNLADEIKGIGGTATFKQHDVTREEQWIDIIQSTITQYKGLDILVNNAGINKVNMVEDLTVEDWRRVMAVNAESAFIGTKYAILAMKPGGAAGKGGSIINISSTGGIVGVLAEAAYCASKGAMRLFTKVAALECGKLNYGIRVNSVHPGGIQTDMIDDAYAQYGKLNVDPSIFPAASEFGRTQDIANGVLFLASEASRFITGSELIIDNGYTAQ